MKMEEQEFISSVDGTSQSFLFAPSSFPVARPLLVALHSWSANASRQSNSLLPLAQELDWHLLLPEFRGPNLASNPNCRQACGSPLAKQDIMDAIENVCRQYIVSDTFLLGGSGGAHMALLMAAYAPNRWTAVSAWCPITDLTTWSDQNSQYAEHIAACCGGEPGLSDEVDAEYRERSPISHLAGLSQTTIFIHHGKSDPSVPFTHSLELYNRLMADFPQAKAYFEVFEGRHEYHPRRAMKWFQQRQTGTEPSASYETITG